MWEIVWKFLKQLKIELPYDSNSTSGYILKRIESRDSKNICTPIFIAAFFTITKMWKQPKCPLTDKLIKIIYLYIYIYVCTYIYTRRYIHTHTHDGILFIIFLIKEEMSDTCYNMDKS